MPSNNSDTTPLTRRAIDLCLDGHDFSEIATRLGVDRPTAIELVQKALAVLPDLQETEKDAIIALEQIRLDALQLPLFMRLENNGDLDTIEPILEIMDRRAKILDLYIH